MTDTPETPAAKRRRLRWISLAELVGVLALLISAASYWDAHRDRERAEAPAPAKHLPPLLLTGTADASRDALALKPASGEAVVQTQTLTFPVSIAADLVETTGNPRLEAGWIVDGLRKALPSREGSGPRLPVGIVTTYVLDGDTRTDVALYDVGYAFRDRMLRARAVELEGITLVRHLPASQVKSAVEARWAKAVPAKP